MAYIGNRSRIALHDSYTKDQVNSLVKDSFTVVDSISDLGSVNIDLYRNVYVIDVGLYSYDAVTDSFVATRQHESRNQVEDFWTRNEIEVIAHRGFKNANVENTLNALCSAVEQGAKSIEFDISVSSDGVPYCFHDTTVDALTNGSGTFTSLSSSYIEGLRYSQADGTMLEGIGIPRLDMVLQELRRKNCFMYPEIKNIKGTNNIDTIVGLFEKYDLLYKSSFQSFDITDIQYLKSINRDAIVSYLVGNASNLESEVDKVVSMSNATVIFNYNGVLSNPGIVKYCRDRGVDVCAYTVNSIDAARQLIDMGVYRIITDYNFTGGI